MRKKSLSNMMQQWQQIGMIPASVYSFRAKNFYGMKDVQEINVAPKTDLEPENANDIISQIPDQLEAGNNEE